MLKFLGNFKGVVQLESLSFTSNSRRFLLYSTVTKVKVRASSPYSNYLVESLGFSEQQSLSTSAKIAYYDKSSKVRESLTFVANANSVVNFFKQLGYDDAQIRRVVSCYPRILNANVEKTLIPKIKLLEEQGFSGSDIADIISANPAILVTGFESRVLPTILALREVFGCDADVISILKTPHWSVLACVSKYLVKNVAFLRSYGIPFEVIRKRLLGRRAPFLRNPETFAEIVVRVEEKLGIGRDSGLFLTAVDLLCCLSEETFESKCNLFKSFGWTQSNILTIIQRNPRCLGLSEARIKRSLSFLMKELNYDPDFLASHHNLLGSSLDKRVVPRHKVLTVLKEKGLLRESYPLYTAISYSETAFLKKFVLPFEEVHEVYCKLIGSSVKMLSQDQSKSMEE